MKEDLGVKNKRRNWHICNNVYVACKQVVLIVWTGGGVVKSMQELWPVQECECLCKLHRKDKKGNVEERYTREGETMNRGQE